MIPVARRTRSAAVLRLLLAVAAVPAILVGLLAMHVLSGSAAVSTGAGHHAGIVTPAAPIGGSEPADAAAAHAAHGHAAHHGAEPGAVVVSPGAGASAPGVASDDGHAPMPSPGVGDGHAAVAAGDPADPHDGCGPGCGDASFAMICLLALLVATIVLLAASDLRRRAWLAPATRLLHRFPLVAAEPRPPSLLVLSVSRT